ncbi:MAG TPA: TIGR02391 family protein [Herpetosiphonaceae bacterium]
MLLTDEELRNIRLALETTAGLDGELAVRCSHLLHIGAFDEAVRNAFVLLEERMRQAVGKEGMTGTDLANYAFSPTNGPLAIQLAQRTSEREGLRELYSGAFKLFRNPTAHGVVGYDAIEGKSIISLVNLLLKILDKADNIPDQRLIPANLEKLLADVEKTSGVPVANRLRSFIAKCIKVGLIPSETGKQWIPFKRTALMQYDTWPKPKSHLLPVFYLITTSKEQGIWFPVNQYYRLVINFNLDNLQKQLRLLGFQPFGKAHEPYFTLRPHTDQSFFEKLTDLVLRVEREVDDTLNM